MSLVSPCPKAVRSCGARTRNGGACGRPAMAGKKRCDMHGGKSPGAPRGNQNARTHGYYAEESVQLRKLARQVIGEALQLIAGNSACK